MRFFVNDIIIFNNNIYIIFDIYNINLETNYMFIDLIEYNHHNNKLTIYCHVDYIEKNFILINHVID